MIDEQAVSEDEELTHQSSHREVYRSQEEQTTAIDLWSVGIIATVMLTAGLDIEEAVAKLSSCDQDTILQVLKRDIFQPRLKLSKDSMTFAWQCLQTSPKDRLTALEAECHDWLCTPEEHLAFFEKLDRRMLENWQAPMELSPLPLRLPSVLQNVPCKPQDQVEHPQGVACLGRRYPLREAEVCNPNPSDTAKEEKLPRAMRDGQAPAKEVQKAKLSGTITIKGPAVLQSHKVIPDPALARSSKRSHGQPGLLISKAKIARRKSGSQHK